MAVDSDRSLIDALGDVAGSVERITRAELRLAMLELGQECRRLGRGALLVAVGGVLAALALGLLLLAAVYALSTAITAQSAALIVGLVTAGVSLICVMAGLKRMRGIGLPKTTASIQESLQWTKTHAT